MISLVKALLFPTAIKFEMGDLWLAKKQLYLDRYCSLDLVEITQLYMSGSMSCSTVWIESDRLMHLPKPTSPSLVYLKSDLVRSFNKITKDEARELGFDIPQ